jgi:hypothetical protein
MPTSSKTVTSKFEFDPTRIGSTDANRIFEFASHSSAVLKYSTIFTIFDQFTRNTLSKMSQAGVVNYLSEQKCTTDKDLAAEWEIMEELYNEK